MHFDIQQQPWILLAHHYLLRWMRPCSGRPVWDDICLSVSVSLRADMADICHLSISDLTAPIIISPPPALPPAIFFFSVSQPDLYIYYQVYLYFSVV